MDLKNGGIDLQGLINTKGLEDKLDPVIKKMDELINRVDGLTGKKAKLSLDVNQSSVDNIDMINKVLDELNSKIKAPKQKMKYFQSIENATVYLKRSWNDLVNAVNKGEISTDKLFDDKLATSVLRYANAFEALKGDVSSVSPEISDFINQMRSMDKYTSKAGYNYTVEGFQEAFVEFEKLKQLGVSFNGFDPIKNDFIQLMSLSNDTKNSIHDIGTQIDSSFGSGTGFMDGVIDEQQRYKEELKETALTLEEMEKRLQSSYKPTGSVYDDDIFGLWGSTTVDNELSDIQKYSQALDQLKEKQSHAVDMAQWYQNKIANGKGTDYNLERLQEYTQDYYKYTEQIEYVQERLQNALRNYTPNADGKNAEAINALVLLLQKLNEQIEQIRVSFGTVDDNSGVDNLLSSIKELKQGLHDAVIGVKNLTESFSGANFNIAFNVSGKSASQQASQLRSVTMDAVEEQIKAYQALTDILIPSGSTTDIFKGHTDYLIRMNNILDGMKTDDSVQKQYDDYKRLINIFKELATINNIDLSSWSSQFEKPLQSAMKTVESVASGSDEIENKFKNLFGQANNITLDGITIEIDKVLKKLQELIDLVSTGFSINDVVQGIDGSEGVASENKTLLSLEERIRKIITAVDEKTEAFRREEETVVGTVQREVTELGVLSGTLQIILETLQKIANIPANAIGDSALSSIKELASQGEALKNVVKILEATDEKIEETKKKVKETSTAQPSDTNKEQEVLLQAGTREWEQIEQAALAYKDVLGDIQKITYSMRQDKDGNELKSYKVIGSKSSITLGENLHQVAEKETREYQKTVEQLNKIRKDFIDAANKAGVAFDLESLKIDKNGVVTFTSTIKKAGDAAVVTKYKIKDLYEAINDGSLNQNYLSAHAEKVSTSSKQTDAQKNEIAAQKELNDLVDKYIAKRNQEANAKNEASKAVYSYESIQLLDEISKKIQEVRNASLLTEDEIKKALGRILDEEDQIVTKLQIRKDTQDSIDSKKSIDSYHRKDQVELYNALTQAVKEYVFWLKEEQSATGFAKTFATSRREESENLMNSLRSDISSYKLTDLEKELELDKQILQTRQKINYQNEVATTKSAEASYEREYKLQEKLYNLKKNNIGADSKTKAKNDVRIADVERAIKNEQQYRDAMGLSNKDIEARNELINRTATLMHNLTVEENAYNEAVKVGNSEAATKFVKATTEVENRLKGAVSNYSNADPSKIAEAQDLIKKLTLPIANYSVDSSNVDAVIKQIEKDANAIISSLRKQHERISNETKYSGQMKDYEKLAYDTFKGATYNDALFKEAKFDSSGKGTLTFLELVGDKARETKIYIDDLESVISKMQSGEFDFDAHKETFKWRKATKNDIFGDDRASAENNQVQKRIDAYKNLIATEDRYQKLQAKVDARTATDTEYKEWIKLFNQRKEYNQLIEETIVLTEKELAFYKQSGEKELDSLRLRYEKQKQESTHTYNAYSANDMISVDAVWDEAHRINDVLVTTQQLKSEIFDKKSNIPGFKATFNSAMEEVDALNNKLKQGNIENIQTGYIDKINKIRYSLNSVIGVVDSSLIGTTDAIPEANRLMSEYAKTIHGGNVKIGDFTNGNKTLTVSFEEQKGIIREVALEFDNMSGTISLVDKGTKQAQSTLTGFVQGLQKRFASLAQYLMTFASFYRIIGMIRKGVTSIRELDTALTEMRKVSDETVRSLKSFQKESFNIAKAVGTTAAQIQNSTADWMRLGESIEDAAKSAEVSNILLNVSEFENIDDATESLVSMSAAYKELDKIEIVDKLNYVGNNFAIATDGLATALQSSASSLKTAKNDIDESIALATAANAVVQDPDKVGAGLRTIALRITGTEAAKEELEELGESVDDFVVTTSSKLNQKVIDLTKTAGKDGISLLDDNGNYRSTYKILQDIADVWETIAEEDLATGQNRQNALLEMLAGKNRSNILASILQSPEILKEAYIASVEDSAGSSEKELDAYLDSINGKIELFTNEVQEFWYNLISSDTIKMFVDAGTFVLDLLGNITDALGEVGTLITGVFAFSEIKALINRGSGRSTSGGRTKKFVLVA